MTSRTATARLALLAAAAVVSVGGCAAAGPADSAASPERPSATPSVVAPGQEGPPMSESSPANGTPITITIEGTALTGSLLRNAPAEALIAQLPLTLAFSDYGGQEKIASLPEALPLDGVPSGSDAPALTIGYYAPDQALVLYYEDVGRYGGIVRLGTVDDSSLLTASDDDFTAVVDVAG